MTERMAVVVTQRSFSGGADVCEDERGRGFGCDPLEIDAIPGRSGRSENAWIRAQLRICIISNSESVSVVWTTSILRT
jgi:hypothetical protein